MYYSGVIWTLCDWLNKFCCFSASLYVTCHINIVDGRECMGVSAWPVTVILFVSFTLYPLPSYATVSIVSYSS